MPLYNTKTPGKAEYSNFGEGTPYSQNMKRKGPMPKRKAKMRRKNMPSEMPQGSMASKGSKF